MATFLFCCYCFKRLDFKTALDFHPDIFTGNSLIPI